MFLYRGSKSTEAQNLSVSKPSFLSPRGTTIGVSDAETLETKNK